MGIIQPTHHAAPRLGGVQPATARSSNGLPNE